MARSKWAATAPLLAAIVVGPAWAEQPVQASAVDAVFARFNDPSAPGCAVSVKAGDAPALERGYGAAELEHGAPITPATVFEAGSVAKQFTAAAALLLVQDGSLRLTDDVRRYLPELPDYGRTITVAQLIEHTSGLRDWGSVSALAGWPRTTRVFTQADALEIAHRQRSLNHDPGETWSYTNTGYNLLTEIVGRVSGRSMAEFTRARIFEPLGMSSTGWRDDFRRIVKGRATAYAATGGGHEQLMPFENTYGHGGLLTTVGDLQRWNAALDDGRLGPVVTAELQRRAQLNSGQTVDYARGLFVGIHRGVREISHSGATAGYRAWLGRWPDHDLSVAVLCNTTAADTGALARAVADLHLPPAPPAPPPAVPSVVLADAATLAGRYLNERTGGILEFEAFEGGLRSRDGAVLTPIAADRARFRDGVASFSGGRLSILGRLGPETYVHVAPWTPTPADLASLTGAYGGEEAAATYVAAVEDGRLTLRLDDLAAQAKLLEPIGRDLFSGPGMVVRVERDTKGRAVALSFTEPRVRGLRFRRLR